MSHQTGITADEELLAFFGQHKQDQRLIKVSLNEERLVLADSKLPNGDWEEDYDSLVLSSLEEKMPCYIIYRLDSCNETGKEWILISYSPDNSPIRAKMLYAATRSTLKKTFGGGQIKDEMFGTTQADVSLAGYQAHLQSQSAPAPLTFAEEELKYIKETETDHHITVDSKHQTVQGVSFPISETALNSVEELKTGHINYVQLSIDIESETINLTSTDDTTADTLQSRFPLDHARYHIFLYKHTHEGDYLESIVFIYSMPGYKCSIKERMLYSSCKSTLLDVLEDHMNLQIERKLEVDVGDKVDEEYLYREVHPAKNVVKAAFAKPKGPAKRGPKRMTKPTPNPAPDSTTD